MITSKEYVARKGSICPACDSINIDGTGRNNYDGDWHSVGIRCMACGAEWDDIYTLSGYGGLDVPEPPTSAPKMVTYQATQEDWNTLFETLEIDAGSGSFDPALRETIREALDRVEEIDLT